MGMLGFFYLFPIGLILFGLDYLAQHFASNYARVATAEIVVIVVMACGYSWIHRTSTLLLPEEFDEEHIVVVYGVQNTPKLTSQGWLGTYNIQMPASGLLFTSSDVDSHFAKARIMKSRVIGDSTSFEEKYGTFAESFRLNMGNNTYECHTWMISRNGTISYSSQTLQKIRTDVWDHLNNFLSTAHE